MKNIIRYPQKAVTLIKYLFTKKILTGYCPVCGKRSFFYCLRDNPREIFECKICGSISRNRHLVIILCDIIGIKEPYSLKKIITYFPSLKIYETQTSGATQSSLKSLSGYTCSEFFPHISPGTVLGNGIHCEDLQKLSFGDNLFDFVITQDVFEHIRNPELAWKEIYRVLKPSGYHIFTVPYSKDCKTVRRIKLGAERDIFILPKVFHGDSIRDGLVYTDFGYDLIEYLDSIGFSTRIFWSGDLDMGRYRIYDSYVFASRKPC